MVIIKHATCPHCQHGIRVSVKQMPQGRYTVTYFDGRDKNAKAKTSICPYCKTDLFKGEILKVLTGLELAQLYS